MKLLITGAAGFIGSHFVDYVLDHHPEDTVIGLDKLTYAGNLDNLAGRLQDRRFRFFRADICDREAVFPLLEREAGGRRGGGSRLTKEGRDLLACYRELERRMDQEGIRLLRELLPQLAIEG